MNRAICVNTWREFKSNWMRVVLLALLILAPLAAFTWQRCFSPASCMADMISHPSIAIAYTLLWGIGVIGKERQLGTITLVFARPVSITTYVISKWMAVGIAASLCSLQALMIEHLISVFANPTLLSSNTFIFNGIERLSVCFGTAAVLVFFSSLVTGIKDLALIIGVIVVAMISASICTPLSYATKGVLDTPQYIKLIASFGTLVTSALTAIAYPSIQIYPLVLYGGNYIGMVFNYVAVITVFLSLAILVLTRKEYSYAQD